MNAPIAEGVNTSGTGDEAHSLGGHELEDVSSAANNSSALITSEKVARQIKAATDPLARQFERLCDLMKELRQARSRRNKEISGLTQGPSKPHGTRFDSQKYLRKLQLQRFETKASILTVDREIL